MPLSISSVGRIVSPYRLWREGRWRGSLEEEIWSSLRPAGRAPGLEGNQFNPRGHGKYVNGNCALAKIEPGVVGDEPTCLPRRGANFCDARTSRPVCTRASGRDVSMLQPRRRGSQRVEARSKMEKWTERKRASLNPVRGPPPLKTIQ